MTLTLSTYCVEHELLIRAIKELERHEVAAPVEAAAAELQEQPSL